MLAIKGFQVRRLTETVTLRRIFVRLQGVEPAHSEFRMVLNNSKPMAVLFLYIVLYST